MDICTFNEYYPLIKKLSEESNKTIAILFDFNVDLLNFDTSDHRNTLLDDIAFNSLHPQILLLTRVYKNSKTFIDNIFCNIPNPLVKTAISGDTSFSTKVIFHNFLYYKTFFSILYELNNVN